MYTDKKLSCKDCGRNFVFSADEQKSLAEKGPLEGQQHPCCPDCRSARRARNKSKPSQGNPGLL